MSFAPLLRQACLSCATRAIGKMPMVAKLQDADGQVVDTAQRDA